VKILVSGCYDILHAGHIQFWSDALEKCSGNYLTVCVPSDRVIRALKGREPTLPQDHRLAVIQSIDIVDEAFIGDLDPPHLNFLGGIGPGRTLVSTDDDPHSELKARLCAQKNASFVMISKTPPSCEPISTTAARRRASIPSSVPLRVDFAGGWLDVPKYAMPGGYIVNCAITPTVSMDEWPYHVRAGLGGSAARALLMGEDPVDSELQIAGWQDAAVIQQTGLCVWKSGRKPVLDMQVDADWLRGHLALKWTGKEHDTKGLLDLWRNYETIMMASRVAKHAVEQRDITLLADAMNISYKQQIEEEMDLVSFVGRGRKYAGSGHGGYIIILFSNVRSRDLYVEHEPDAIAVEPYTRSW